MAEAEIFKAIREMREGIDRNEVALLRSLARQWVPSYHYLKKQVDALMAAIQAQRDAGEPVWIGYVHSLERYQSMMEQTRRAIDKYNRAALGRISGAEADAVKIGNANAKKLINIAEPDDPLWTRINQREGRIISGMLSDTSPLRRLLDKSWGETSRKLDEVLTVGLSTGQGSAWIAQRMMDAVTIPEKRALLIARTEVNRAYRAANLETMRESRAVRGYRRMCYPPTACFACLMMDGEYYDKVEDFSDHPNGKCSAVPVTRHFDPINEPGWERGQDWFEKQTPDVQRKIMGPGRYDLWKNEGVNLRDMVYIKPNPLWGGSPAMKTLEELRENMDSRVFFRKGVPVEPSEITYEQALNRDLRIAAVVEKYHINLRGSGKPISVVFDDTIRADYGLTNPEKPDEIRIGNMAFASEEELARTIAHELVHSRELLKTGQTDENRSYQSDWKLHEYIVGLR